MQHWQNFDIELFDHDTVGDVESVRVRVTGSPAGEMGDGVTVEVAASLRTAADALAQDAMSLEHTVGLGKQLAGVLLPDDVADLFDNSRANLGPDAGLRIRIKMRALPLADLPWEYVYRTPIDADNSAIERGFLALDRAVSIVRYEPVPQPPGTCAPLAGERVAVAMLLASPEIAGWAILDLDRELKTVRSALQDEADVELTAHASATEQAMNEALDNRPHVFHFSGHGRFKLRPSDQHGVYVGDGELMFEKEDGSADPVSARKLATKMRGSGVRLAVLNSCESARRDSLNAFTGVAPTLVREGVPAVVAMQYGIRDAQALRFARRLYHNLANHKSIDAAVSAARLAMFSEGEKYVRDWGVPVLYLRSDQAVLFPDVTTAAPRRPPKLGIQGLVNLVLSVVLVFVSAYFYWRHVDPRLPFGNIVGGVLAIALVAAIAYLNFIAGESLRLSLLMWFRKRMATGVLATTLAVLGVALVLTPNPIGVRVVAGKSLLGSLARHDLVNPLRIYQLVVSDGSHTVSTDDFRKGGVIIADSAALATRMATRYEEESAERMMGYLTENGLNHENYLGSWRPHPVPLALQGLGNAETVMLTLKEGDTTESCQTLPASAFVDRMTVVFMENWDACD